MQKLMFSLACVLCVGMHENVNAADPAWSICTPGEPSALESLAAREVRRYVYLRTGELLPIRSVAVVAGAPSILAARKDRPEIKALAGDPALLAAVAALKPQEYLLKSIGPNLLLIAGGDDAGVLYGAYAFAEKLGVRFYLHGDVVPDGKIPFLISGLNESGRPLFALRGIQPFHDFPEGPDWWNTDDYLAYVSQLAKLRMNFIGLHCYPEGSFGPESLVWIGVKEDVDETGAVKFSYPSFWANTLRSTWGYAPTKTGDFAGGAARLFADDVYGNEVQAGLMPAPKSPEESNELFNRSAAMMRRVFERAKSLGITTCLGTESPLTVPAVLKAHLKEIGKDPADPAVVRELYEGIFTRIQRACPVDYYWLWTPEGWTWHGNTLQQYQQTEADIKAAMGALSAVGNPLKLATCGWVLGPQQNRSAIAGFLPKDSPMGCINRKVGHEGVEPTFANISGRPKWAIPWMENDPTLTQPQPWVGRMRYDAADALRLGCTGLFGIHWRTKAMMQNVSALASAGWDQSWVPASFDSSPAKPVVESDGALGGSSATFASAAAGADEAAIYQSVRYGMTGYKIDVPDGKYSVTLKFVEPVFAEAGKRVFGVSIQGKQVVENLDIFAKAGRNRAIDLLFPDVDVVHGSLAIDFQRHVENPCVAGIVIDGQTKASNQLATERVIRKINCGGGKLLDYEADRAASESPKAPKDRTMPIAGFYADFARANFGEAVAEAAGAIMASVDGVKMPQISDWKGGPGGLVANPSPWETVKKTFEFVEAFAGLRMKIQGAGNLERFDYWLNSYRAAEAIAHIGCLRGELDRAAKAIDAESDAVKKKALASPALGIREQMARAWEQLMSYQAAAADTPGEFGTIANLERHVRRTQHFIDAYDKKLADALGAPLPAVAAPSADYSGPARIIVPTVRTQVDPGEELKLSVIILDNRPARSAAIFWRALGRGEFQKSDLQHIGRGSYSARLPAGTEAFEYYVAATSDAGKKLVWPATAPAQNQTVVVDGAKPADH